MARIFRRAFATCEHLAGIRMNSTALSEMFLPPVNRSMRDLDRSFFKKTIPTSAATIFEARNIATVKKALEKTGECLQIRPLLSLVTDPTVAGAKCLILQPNVKHLEPESWSTTMRGFVEKEMINIHPYGLTLTYDDWTMSNILEATLPDFSAVDKETPTGFETIGHVGEFTAGFVTHLNLREQYLPYKHLIGQVLLDKNPKIHTVVNKLQDVGSESVFRTFPYEVLAGINDLDVTIRESGCEFQFNYGQVYWNTKLNTEHARMIDKFKPGEAVCDVMAGVGPFAVPAGRKMVFVRANDLNPAGYEALQWATKRNHVEAFVQSESMDGRDFIRKATRDLPRSRRTVTKQSKPKLPRACDSKEKQSTKNIAETWVPTVLTEPSSFDHYVMNLPKTAVEFLDAFWGSHRGREEEFNPHTNRRLPMVHVYLFTPNRTRSQDQGREEQEEAEVCETVSNYLGHKITPQTPDVDLWYVRIVSPAKKMYCASFRLPPEVAFAGEKAVNASAI